MSLRYVDTHCHLDVLLRMDFDAPLQEHELDGIEQLVFKAQCAGVSDFISVGTNRTVSQNAVFMANRLSGVWATLGLHPTDVHDDWRSDVKVFRELLRHNEHKKIVGIGEVGIDLFKDVSKLALQKDVFKAHIELALEHNLPLVFHIRDEVGNDRSAEHALRVLEKFGPAVRGVLHCFQQSQNIATEALARGFLLGLDAPIGYPKNDWLRSIVKNTPLRSLVLETDAPFLPPPELRGKKNEPEAVVYVAQKIAEIKSVSHEEVARVTTENAQRLFGL